MKHVISFCLGAVLAIGGVWLCPKFNYTDCNCGEECQCCKHCVCGEKHNPQ